MHRHSWSRHSDSAVAVFSKRDDDQTPDQFWAEGQVLKCGEQPCEAFYFKPSDQSLSAVECVLIEVLPERRGEKR